MFWLGIWIFCASKIAFSAKSNRSIITLQKPNALLLLVLLLYCAFIQKLKTSTNHARSWAAKSGSLRSSALPNTHSFNAWGRSSWFFFFFASDKFHLIFFIIYIFFYTFAPYCFHFWTVFHLFHVALKWFPKCCKLPLGSQGCACLPARLSSNSTNSTLAPNAPQPSVYVAYLFLKLIRDMCNTPGHIGLYFPRKPQVYTLTLVQGSARCIWAYRHDTVGRAAICFRLGWRNPP